MNTDTKNWHVDRKDRKTIEQIAERAVRALAAQGLRMDCESIRMSLLVCHANGCPLRLMDLLNAHAASLLSDVSRIYKHLDRETGQLMDGFVPRFAAKKETCHD